MRKIRIRIPFTKRSVDVSFSTTDTGWISRFFSGGKTATGVTVNEQTSLRATAVLACVKILSETIASLPLPVYKRLKPRGKERAPDHPLYHVLHDLANDEMTSFTWRETMESHIALWGNCYSEIEYDDMWRIRALWPLRPDRTYPERDPTTGRIIFKTTLSNGQGIILPQERVLHIPGLGFDGLKGYSNIAMAREAIGMSLAAEEYGARFFGNGANPGGILEHPGKLKEPDRLREQWYEMHQGLSNQHRIAVLEEGMHYKQIGIPPEDAQFLETRKFQVTEIARIFRVPPHMIADLERATFCMPADVEVMTETGPKSIAEVKPGEKVWSLGETGMCLATVKYSVCSGTDEILKIRTTNRTIRANAVHRILVRRKYPDPKPSVGGYQCVKWVNEYVPAGELKAGDTIVTLESLPGDGVSHCPTRELTIGFMEFCGLLLGDGNVYKGWGVSIARANDAKYMDYYRKVIKEEFVSFGKNGNGRSRERVNTQPVYLQEQDRQTRFSSVLAAEELEKLGFCGDARSKRVPGWVFTIKPELKLALLRGFLDADGSVDKKGRIAFHSVNREMLSQLRHLCLSVGIPVTNIQGHERSPILPSGKRHTSRVYTFTCSDPGANRQIWSNDSRYQERLLSGQSFGKKDRNYPRFGGKGFNLDGCGLARITSIEKQPTEPVYDLEVEGTHSFIANGVVVHNSNIEHQSIEFVVHTIRPWLVRWEQALMWKLLTPSERKKYLIEFLVDGLLRGDIKSRYDAYAVAKQNGWMNSDDIRELENQNPLPDGQGEIYYVPLNMIPANQAGDYWKARQLAFEIKKA